MSGGSDARVAPFVATDNDLTSTTPSNTTTGQSTEAFKDVVFGSVAGMVGKIIEYPFDTVKVRLQSQSGPCQPHYTGPIDCFRQAIRAEGALSLYRGISAPLIGAAIETSSLFFSYRIAQTTLQATLLPVAEGQPLPLNVLVACGAASGAFTSLLLTPIELVKCQMQVPTSSLQQTRRPTSIIASVFRHHGILGFWHGQLGTLIRETGGSAAWFGSYEGFSALFRKYNATKRLQSLTGQWKEAPKSSTLPIYQQLLAGASAGVSYNFIFFPADTIKSRMQTDEVTVGMNDRRTFWASGKVIWEQHGIKGMYRGCGITLARAAPSSAFIFAVNERLRIWWG